MAHELCHAIGFWHEQSRPNRDDYVVILEECVEAGKEHNFDIHSDAGHYGPYDFDSVMHYGEDAFLDTAVPTCTRTISVTSGYGHWQTQIGQRGHLSEMDQLVVSFVYAENDWRFVDQAYAGAVESGTFFEPYKQFPDGEAAVPSGGRLFVQPGTYAAVGTYDTVMTLEAPLGGVTLGD